MGAVASKAKVPLLAGGAAAAGIAGGVAARNRLGAPKRAPKRSGALDALKGVSSLKPGGIDLSKVDIDTITDAGKRAGEIGRQIGEIAGAVERARKK